MCNKLAGWQSSMNLYIIYEWYIGVRRWTSDRIIHWIKGYLETLILATYSYYGKRGKYIAICFIGSVSVTLIHSSWCCCCCRCCCFRTCEKKRACKFCTLLFHSISLTLAYVFSLDFVCLHNLKLELQSKMTNRKSTLFQTCSYTPYYTHRRPESENINIENVSSRSTAEKKSTN